MVQRAEIKDLKARLKILVDQLSAADFKDGKLETVKIGMPGDLAAFNALMLSSIKAAIASVTGLPAEQITVTVRSLLLSANAPLEAVSMPRAFLCRTQDATVRTFLRRHLSHAVVVCPPPSPPHPRAFHPKRGGWPI